MDENLVNLIKNSISNDYCRLICIEATEEENQICRQLYLVDLMVYCVIYDMPYFVENIHKEKPKHDFLNCQDQIDFIYLYYLENNNKENIELKNKIIEKYKRRNRKISKEIKTLKLINFDRRIIEHNRKKQLDKVIERTLEIKQRLDIIAECMKYKFLVKYLNLESNGKIDRILKWNISMVRKINTIDDKIWLM